MNRKLTSFEGQFQVLIKNVWINFLYILDKDCRKICSFFGFKSCTIIENIYYRKQLIGFDHFRYKIHVQSLKTVLCPFNSTKFSDCKIKRTR